MQTLFSKGFWKMVSGFVVIIMVAISIMLGVGLYGQKLNSAVSNVGLSGAL